MKTILTFPFFLILTIAHIGSAQPISDDYIEKASEADRLMISFQFQKAISLIDSLSQTFPQDLKLKERLGYCYFRLGNYYNAEQIFLEIIKTDSTSLQALNELAQIAFKQGDLELSRKYYSLLCKIDSSNSYYFKQLGVINHKKGSAMEALAMFSKAIELNKKDVEAYVYLTESLQQMEMYEAGDSIIELGLQLDSANYNLKMLRAKSSLNQKRFEDVIKNISKILVSRDTLPIHANFLGAAYFAIKTYNKVIPCMKFLINANADQDWVYYYLGVSYREVGDKENAIKFLKLAIQKGISKNVYSYYNNLGIAYEENNEYEKAIWSFEKAAEYKKSKILLFRLANCYDQLKENKKQALQYYKAYLTSGDTNSLLLSYSQNRVMSIQNKSNTDTTEEEVIIPDTLLIETE